jgi:hypothetical protein
VAAKRRKDPLWARLILVFGAVLIVVSGGTVVAAQTLISRATNAITQTNLLQDDAGAAAQEGGNDIDGAVNLQRSTPPSRTATRATARRSRSAAAAWSCWPQR